MIETILSTVLSSALLLKSPTLSSTPQTPPYVFTRVLPEENYVSYVVGKNETLKTVAFTYYGSEDYWTTLWNDNPWIGDPNNLPTDRLLKIRSEKPHTPDQLQEDLIEQMKANVNTQKNSSVDQTIAAETLSPTMMPTPTPVSATLTITSVPTVVPSPATVTNPSGISEEALNYLGNCEAGMNPTRNSGNGYYGAFQFSYGTWKSMNTGYERADLAPIEVQKSAVKQLLQRSSIYNQFPGCAAKMHGAGMI